MKVYRCEGYDWTDRIKKSKETGKSLYDFPIGETVDYGLFASREAAERHMTEKFNGIGTGFVIEDCGMKN